MRVAVKIVLFLFVFSLATPTLVGSVKRNSDTSAFFNFNEEEIASKSFQGIRENLFSEMNFQKAVFADVTDGHVFNYSLLFYPELAFQIFLPPPDTI